MSLWNEARDYLVMVDTDVPAVLNLQCGRVQLKASKNKLVEMLGHEPKDVMRFIWSYLCDVCVIGERSAIDYPQSVVVNAKVHVIVLRCVQIIKAVEGGVRDDH